MAVGVVYQSLVDSRAVGNEVVRSDFFTIPGSVGAGTVEYRLIEVPLNVVTAPSLTNPIYVRTVHPVTHVPLGPIFTQVLSPTVPLATQFQINPSVSGSTFTFGKILLSQFDAGSTVEIIYTGRGSLVFASDVNDPRDELLNSRSTESSLGSRLGLIEDGTRILSGKIVPRHISTSTVDDYTFPHHVVVQGNLTVNGVLTYINSTTFDVGENLIDLQTALVGSPTLDAGINIHRGTSSTVSFLWRESQGLWEMTGGGFKFDGTLDMNHNQFKSGSAQYVASQVAETALVSSATDGQLIWRTDKKALRAYNATAGAFSTVGATMSRFDVVAGTPNGTYTGSSTSFDLPFSFNVGSSQLLVYYEGVLQTIGSGNDYTETSSTNVTTTFTATSGRNLSFINIAIPV